MSYNPILDTDSYKFSHYLGYPDDISQVYSYAESRGGLYDSTIMFGVQSYVRHLAANPITREHIQEAEAFAGGHGVPFNKAGWDEVVDSFGGHWPIEIKSADEGLLIPTRNVLTTVVCESDFKWATSYIETSFLAHLWPSVTIATRIFGMKRKLAPIFQRTTDSGKVNPFAVLNFGARGSIGRDHVEIGGAAHLTCFMGTDSILAVKFVNDNYGSSMSGQSVPATEHSVMCSWKSDGVPVIRQLLERMGQRGGILSIVGDTWNIYEFTKAACSIADEFKAAGVTLVVRPDSGTMESITREILKELMQGFGCKINRKGFFVIDGAKMLWADGVDENTFTAPFLVAEEMRVSADCIMVGSGGGLIQKGLDRDTCKFAFKASALRRIYGAWEGIAKDPITDQGKRSKKGRLALMRDESGGFLTVSAGDSSKIPGDLLKTRYNNGRLDNPTTMDEIRERVDAYVYAEAA